MEYQDIFTERLPNMESEQLNQIDKEKTNEVLKKLAIASRQLSNVISKRRF